MRGNQTGDWLERDLKHHLHPFSDGRELRELGMRVITRADGVYLTDSENNRILDGMAGLWCVNIGYGRDEIAEAAARQLQELPYYNTFFRTTTPPVIDLATRLSEITPEPINHFFFTNSGSEANDTIIKLVRYYWNLRGKRSKKIIVARDYAYHGVTMASASLSGLTDMHPQSDLPLPGIATHIEGPYWFRHGGDLTPEEYGIKAARALEEKILELGADNVGAFIGEPVYGAGGVMVPPSTYWPEINRICRQYDVLLIADEVVCGFGRTGNWFGSQTYGIEPDLMAFAKGLSSGYAPIAGVGVSDEIAGLLLDEGGEWVHGFTYSGHPLTCAIALKNLEIITREDLVGRVRDDIGPYFQGRMGELRDHPLVGEVRGVGLLAAVELVADKASRRAFPEEAGVARRAREYAFTNGLVMRAVRDCNMFSPPLTISREQVDDLVGIVSRCYDRVLAELESDAPGHDSAALP